MVFKEKDAKLQYMGIVISENSHILDVDALEGLKYLRTKLVTFQHVSNVLESTHPLKYMAHILWSCIPDIKILIDAYQLVPQLPVNV